MASISPTAPISPASTSNPSPAPDGAAQNPISNVAVPVLESLPPEASTRLSGDTPERRKAREEGLKRLEKSMERDNSRKLASMKKLDKINSKYDPNEILDFLRIKIKNVENLALDDMHEFPHKQLESKHDYIQWMFPTRQQSRYNTEAPIVTDEIAEKMAKDEKIIKNAKKSFDVMLNFYGLQYKDGRISKAENFEERANNWIPGGYDHNHSRLSRIIESLQLFGLKEEAKALFNCLKLLWLEDSTRFTLDTIKEFYKKAGEDVEELLKKQEELIKTKKIILEEPKQIEHILDEMIKAKKKEHWIQADLSISKSSWIGRVMWVVLKHFACLRDLFYDIDLKESHNNWMILTKKIAEDPRLKKLTDKWRQAAVNYNAIVSERHQLKEVKKFNQLTLTIKPGDITAEPADVIVNAANEALLGGSGVDGAIHKKGGGEILKECRAIRAERKKQMPNRNENSSPGEAAITTAGNLPAKHVVHTVGPRWQGGNKNEEATLYDAYANSLAEAAKKGHASVNFPSLSTGIFGFPLEKAAPKMVEAISEYSKNNSTIRKVSLIAFWPADFLAYSDAVKQAK